MLRPARATWLLCVRSYSVFSAVVVQLLLQFFSFLLLRLLVPLLVDVRLEAFRPTVRVVALQDVDQVVDVRGRQSQGFDLAQFRVAGDIGDAISERGEGGVDRLSPPSLLLVRPHPKFVPFVCSDRTDSVAREEY